MRFEVRRSNSATQSYYWRIVAANERVLATSETYHNKADVQAAIRSVKTYAGSAQVVDQTTRPLYR